MSSTLSLLWSGATDQGKVRKQNQDSYFGDPRGRFLILADGMGGHSGGEIASQLTVDATAGVLNDVNWEELPSPEDLVEACVTAATDSLKNWVKSHPEQSDLGTTLLLFIRDGSRIILASLGDSRIYLRRAGGLYQITFDQVIETELRRRGADRNQAAKSPGAGYLSRCILASRTCDADVMCIEGQPYDEWLLCSDGLTREVEHDKIKEILVNSEHKTPQESADALIEQALENGGRDNVTVIVARTPHSSAEVG
jgi:protein phosphatase